MRKKGIFEIDNLREGKYFKTLVTCRRVNFEHSWEEIVVEILFF